MGQHAFLAPSSAHIWAPPGGCRAFPLMAAMYPQPESDESREGDACHEAGQKLVYGMLDSTRWPCDLQGFVASNGVVLTPELLEAVEVYARDVSQAIRERATPGGGNYGLETRLAASPVLHPENWGTPDAWLYDRLAHTLVVWDAKFGFGIVEAQENWQALNYIGLLLHKLFPGESGLHDETLRVEVRIIQPRAPHRDGPVRVWTLEGKELRPYMNDIAQSAQECTGDDPVARSGNHCRYCPGRHACGTAQRAAMASVDYATGMMPEDLDPEGVALELRTLRRAEKAIKYRLTGLEEQAKEQAKQGTRFPGLALTPTYGREKWKADNAEVYGLGEMYGVDLRQDKPITPNQAAAKGIDADVIKEYSHKPQSGVELVEDDKTLASLVFKPKA